MIYRACHRKLTMGVWGWLAAVSLVVCLMTSCNQRHMEKKYRIGFSQCTGGDAWRQQMILAMNGELAFHPDISLEYKDAENSSDRQIRDIEYFINQKVDLLIVSPNEAEPITPVVEKAFKSGIPVIVIDRRTSSSLYSAFIGANNYEIGKLSGGYVAELLKGKGSILEIWGLRGSSPAIDRHRGFAEILSQYPDIKVVKEIDGKWELDTAKRQLSRQFATIPNVDLVFAHNDIMAFGAHQIFNSRKPGNNVRFIGIDGLPGPAGGIQFVDDGILNATFLYPTGGEEAIRIANLILTGRPYEKENVLHSTVINAKNVRVMKLQTDKITTQQKDIVRQQNMINEQIQTYYSQRILIYILLVSLVVVIIVGAVALLSWREKNEVNRRLEAKTREITEQRNTIEAMAQKAELAIQEKLRFFTNISHEFKTPLTLIMGPIEELETKGVDGRVAKENISLIKKNALRLLRLVNQLMDFKKIEEKKLVMRVSEMDIIQFTRETMAAFEAAAVKRKIDFQLTTEFKQLYAWFDPNMLDKVIFNLLSNAFKFTNDKGKILIDISIDKDNRNVLIMVEDNGVGMSREFTQHAFDRFHTEGSYGGTGLGLSLSKEFMEAHHGDLILSSERGKGTRFFIVLPLGKVHFDADEFLEQPNWVRPSDFDMLAAESVKVISESSALEEQKDYTVLLIDDNAELRAFLKKRLENYYNVVESAEGVTGLHLANDIVPDVVICDVMLPGEKDGFQVARELKEDRRTSHIPIIILTAKGSIEQKIAGVQTGADEYITKPFIFEYLHERIKSLIRNRESLKEHYSLDLSIDPQSNTPGSLDKKFVNEFIAQIEKNISNPEFNVNDLGRELGMSRVQVYRKVKALLGFSVNDYIINVRLKKAKSLLLETNMSIADISSEVGFSSPTYFSTTFKSKINMSPKEFKLSQGGGAS